MRATKVNAGLAESNGRLLLGIWRDSLHVTCGLTACTPGSAPGPTLGNEYGKTLSFTLMCVFCDSAAASQSSVLGRVVTKHRRSEPHWLQHAVCVQDADDDLSRNRSVGDHAFTVDHSQLDPSSVRKVSTTESYILWSELSRCKLSPTLATRDRPKFGFGYGVSAESTQKYGFGLVSVTAKMNGRITVSAVSHYLVSAWLRLRPKLKVEFRRRFRLRP